MAHLSRTACTLRIMGDALDPDEISRRLDATPSEAGRKGDIREFSSGRTRVERTGAWHLKVVAREPGDLDAQVLEIVSQTTPDLSVWRDLSSRFRCELFCGFFMDGTDEGISISAETTRMIGDRGLSLELCLYAPTQSGEIDA